MESVAGSSEQDIKYCREILGLSSYHVVWFLPSPDFVKIMTHKKREGVKKKAKLVKKCVLKIDILNIGSQCEEFNK